MSKEITEFEMYVKCEDGEVGYAWIYLDDNKEPKWDVTMWQGRLDLTLPHNEAIEEIGESSKGCWDKLPTRLEAVNKVLDYWFIEPITESELKILEPMTVQEAIKREGKFILTEFYSEGEIL